MPTIRHGESKYRATSSGFLEIGMFVQDTFTKIMVEGLDANLKYDRYWCIRFRISPAGSYRSNEPRKQFIDIFSMNYLFNLI